MRLMVTLWGQLFCIRTLSFNCSAPIFYCCNNSKILNNKCRLFLKLKVAIIYNNGRVSMNMIPVFSRNRTERAKMCCASATIFCPVILARTKAVESQLHFYWFFHSTDAVLQPWYFDFKSPKFTVAFDLARAVQGQVFKAPLKNELDGHVLK